jgi:16S rRNA (uracil1498-N3)-methyltransferase
MIMDGAGRAATCELVDGFAGDPRAAILHTVSHPRPRPEIVVYQGAGKGSKVDSVVERLGALGAAELVVFSSERSVVAWDATKAARLRTRWAAVARAAAKQSGNPWIMATSAPLQWPELVARVEREPHSVLLWKEAHVALREVISEERIALIAGPEGGIARAEAVSLEAVGAVSASLGPRVLRTEEAAVAAVVGLLWHFGAIG